MASNNVNRTTQRGRERHWEQHDDVRSDEPLARFFEHYPSFHYNPHVSSSKEFYRMCHRFRWDRDNRERKDAYDDFKTALVQQFNFVYGTDDTSLETWQGLSRALDIDPLPISAAEAKVILRSKHVNLVDLVDRHGTGKRVKKFKTLHELQEYTIAEGKYFPKESAYAGGVLKLLLREILS